MKLAFVSGPYRHPDEWRVRQNIEEARRVARLLWLAGFAVLCAHSNSAGFGGSDLPDEAFLEGDLVMLRRCDLVVLVNGWETSEGARRERMAALNAGIPVWGWTDESATGRPYLIDSHTARFLAGDVPPTPSCPIGCEPWSPEAAGHDYERRG